MNEIYTKMIGGIIAIYLIMLLIALIVWLVSCMAHYKMFKMMNYQYPIAAWIPYWRSYALADVVVGKEKQIIVFGLKVPATLFKLYWLVSFALALVIPGIGSIISFILTSLCVGICYGRIYSVLEKEPIEDCLVLGIVSGFIRIIAVIKFLIIKK